MKRESEECFDDDRYLDFNKPTKEIRENGLEKQVEKYWIPELNKQLNETTEEFEDEEHLANFIDFKIFGGRSTQSLKERNVFNDEKKRVRYYTFQTQSDFSINNQLKKTHTIIVKLFVNFSKIFVHPALIVGDETIIDFNRDVYFDEVELIN